MAKCMCDAPPLLPPQQNFSSVVHPLITLGPVRGSVRPKVTVPEITWKRGEESRQSYCHCEYMSWTSVSENCVISGSADGTYGLLL